LQQREGSSLQAKLAPNVLGQVGVVETAAAAAAAAALAEATVYWWNLPSTQQFFCDLAKRIDHIWNARPEGVPEDWVEKPSKKGGGTVWQNPSNPHDSVRDMPGNPDSPNPAQRRPYVKRMKDGLARDVGNNPVEPFRPNPTYPEKISGSFREELAMMTSKVWCCRIMATLSELSDSDYQSQVWIHGDPGRISSFTEAVNRLYDDYDLGGFLAKVVPSLEHSGEIAATLATLGNALERIDERLAASTIVALPEWPRIRELAGSAKRLLSEECDALPDG
jgi:hypothetical protein